MGNQKKMFCKNVPYSRRLSLKFSCKTSKYPWGGSFWCKFELIFACLTMKFQNCHHSNDIPTYFCSTCSFYLCEMAESTFVFQVAISFKSLMTRVLGGVVLGTWGETPTLEKIFPFVLNHYSGFKIRLWEGWIMRTMQINTFFRIT